MARAVVPGAEGSLRLRHAAHTKQYRPAAQHPCTLSCDVCLIRLAPVSRPTAHIILRYSAVDIGHHHFKILVHGDTLAIKHPVGPRMMRRGGLPRTTRLFCSINKSLTGVVSTSAVTGSNFPRSRRDAVLRFRECVTSPEPTLADESPWSTGPTLAAETCGRWSRNRLGRPRPSSVWGGGRWNCLLSSTGRAMQGNELLPAEVEGLFGAIRRVVDQFEAAPAALQRVTEAQLGMLSHVAA